MVANYTPADSYGNQYYGSPGATEDTLSGDLSFNSVPSYLEEGSCATYDNNASIDVPVFVYQCTAVNQWDAGTFQFTSTTPEPSTAAMLGLGSILLFAFRKRMWNRP